jgi:ubiquinone biosynthesis monooxygenase Coq7
MDKTIPTSGLPDFHLLPLPIDIIRELRSDHAGETGAVYIYKGILAISKDSQIRSFAYEHLSKEQEHLTFFDSWLPTKHHSALLILWRFSGFTLGACSALLGKKVLFSTIDSVEKFVVEHYQQQINLLSTLNKTKYKPLINLLNQFKTEEAHHREDAITRLKSKKASMSLNLWKQLVESGSAGAVKLARLI